MLEVKEVRHTKEVILVGDEQRTLEIPFGHFQRLFYPAFCITCHKSQGSTFDHECTVHEWEKFNRRLKYVALSRATAHENIRVW